MAHEDHLRDDGRQRRSERRLRGGPADGAHRPRRRARPAHRRQGRALARPAARRPLADRPDAARRALRGGRAVGRAARARSGAGGLSGVGGDELALSHRQAARGRRPHLAARRRVGRADDARSRQEPPRSLGRRRGGRRPAALLLPAGRGRRRLRAPAGQAPPGRRDPLGAAPARRLGGHRAVQLPAGARRRHVGGRPRRRQHGGLQAGGGRLADRPPPRRDPRRVPSAGGLQPGHRIGRHARPRLPRPRLRRPRLHRLEARSASSSCAASGRSTRSR